MHIHPSPSVGGIIKKILAINPDLGVADIQGIMRQATSTRAQNSGDFAGVQIVSEDKALELAKATLNQAKRPN